MGDPSKMIILESVIEVIFKENLLAHVSKVGSHLLKEIKTLENEFSSSINSTRGRGTFIAFDCSTSDLRDSIIKKFLTKGKRPILYNVTIFQYILKLYFQEFRWGGAEIKLSD